MSNDDRHIECNPDEIARLMYDGQLEALDRITRCYGDRLTAVGRRYCGCDELARDAIQDSLVIVAHNLQNFRGEGSLEGWLVRIVQNVCRRMHHGRKNDPSLHVSLEDRVAISPAQATGDRVRAGQFMAILAGALEELLPQDRALILLSDAEGWTGPELARAFDMTPEAIRARLSRARKRLRQRLEPFRREFLE